MKLVEKWMEAGELPRTRTYAQLAGMHVLRIRKAKLPLAGYCRPQELSFSALRLVTIVNETLAVTD